MNAPRQFAVVALLVLLAGASPTWGEPAAGEPLRVEVRLGDEALTTPYAWVWLDASGRAMARGTSADLNDGRLRLPPGARRGRLLVGAFPCELGEVRVEGESSVLVRLEPAHDVAHVSLVGRTRALRARLSCRFQREGIDFGPLDIGVALAPEGSRIPIPRDGSVRLVTMPGPDEMVWPAAAVLSAGEPLELHSQRLRTVTLQAAGEARRSGREWRVLHDFGDRLAWAPARIDALLWTVRSKVPRVRSVGGRYQVDLPDAAFHLYAWGPDGEAYAHVDAAARTVSVEAGRRRTLHQVPRVGGEPAPEGSRLCVGRVDAATFGALRDNPELRNRFTLRVPRADAWRPMDLPACPALTLYDPAHGFAYLDGSGPGPATGTWEPGRIIVRAAGGGRLSGHVLVTATRRGTGEMKFAQSYGMIRAAVDGAEAVVLPGAPEGSYVLRTFLEYTPAGVGAKRPVRYYLVADVSHAAPTAILNVPVDP